MSKVLIVTNDFPPRSGGIQSFVHALALRLPTDGVVVYAPAWPGAAEFDCRQPFPVIRHPGSLMLPVPSVGAHACALLAAHDCDSVLFGAAAPLGLLAPRLRRAGAQRIVGITHGHEAGWAALPGARAVLRRIGAEVDVLTYLADYFRIRLARALSGAAATEMVRLAPGVDTAQFRPGAGGALIRRQLGIAADRPVVVCVSRMVPRKGQDTLIRAWPAVRAQVTGDPLLLLVGDGPYRSRLDAIARQLGVTDSVTFTGPVGWEDLPAYYDAGNVFAMPCRTRRAGLDVEGLGIVYLEAAATGLPVIGGDSGGAPDAILDGETGYVVSGRGKEALTDRLVELLSDPAGAAAMGDKGRSWIEREWTWDIVTSRFQQILAATPDNRAAGTDSNPGGRLPPSGRPYTGRHRAPVPSARTAPRYQPRNPSPRATASPSATV
jgi:phosphatidyl-myo-inositol dimannoside synthase